MAVMSCGSARKMDPRDSNNDRKVRILSAERARVP